LKTDQSRQKKRGKRKDRKGPVAEKKERPKGGAALLIYFKRGRRVRKVLSQIVEAGRGGEPRWLQK